MIEEITTTVYKVNGFNFNTKQEAIEFEESHEFVYDGYDDCWQALNKRDVEKYEKKFKEDLKGLCNLYIDLGNSNSMGAMYPLAVIGYVLSKHNFSSSDAWKLVNS